jgi:hypothetical protein
MAVNSGTAVVIKSGANVLTCLVDSSMDASRDMFEVTNQLSAAGAKEYKPGEKGYTIPISGLVDEGDTYGAFYLLGLQIAKTAVSFTYGKLAVNGAITLAGSAYISNWSTSFPKNGAQTFSCTLQVTGDFTPGTVSSPATLPSSTGSVNSGTDVLINWNSAVFSAQTGGSFNCVTDMIDVTGKHSTAACREFIPGEYSFDFSFEGLVDESLSNDAFDALTALRSGTNAAFIIGRTASGAKTIEGSGMVQSLNIAASKNTAQSYSGSIRGTGELSIGTV